MEASAAEETAEESKEDAVKDPLKMEEGDAEFWEEADAIVEASETDEDTDEEMAAEWWRYGPGEPNWSSSQSHPRR